MKILLLIPVILLLTGCQTYTKWHREEVDEQILTAKKCKEAGLEVSEWSSGSFYCSPKKQL